MPVRLLPAGLIYRATVTYEIQQKPNIFVQAWGTIRGYALLRSFLIETGIGTIVCFTLPYLVSALPKPPFFALGGILFAAFLAVRGKIYLARKGRTGSTPEEEAGTGAANPR